MYSTLYVKLNFYWFHFIYLCIYLCIYLFSNWLSYLFVCLLTALKCIILKKCAAIVVRLWPDDWRHTCARSNAKRASNGHADIGDHHQWWLMNEEWGTMVHTCPCHRCCWCALLVWLVAETRNQMSHEDGGRYCAVQRIQDRHLLGWLPWKPGKPNSSPGQYPNHFLEKCL